MIFHFRHPQGNSRIPLLLKFFNKPFNWVLLKFFDKPFNWVLLTYLILSLLLTELQYLENVHFQ